jgi:superfamily I DNA/RNA helicase
MTVLVSIVRLVLPRSTRAAGRRPFTLHSVGWRLVRLYGEPMGLPPRLSVLDAADSADLLDLVLEELGYAASGKRFPRETTLADILVSSNERHRSHFPHSATGCGGCVKTI